jgi:hypothetical protein
MVKLVVVVGCSSWLFVVEVVAHLGPLSNALSVGVFL